MPRPAGPTRKRILDAAYRLFRSRGFRPVSMDEIAAAARLTKRTLYHHFRSKDDLLADVLRAQDELAVQAFRTFGDKLSGSAEAIVEGLFRDLAVWADRPHFLGSGFTRLVIELADMPGHPARAIARRHKAKLESLLAGARRHRRRAPARSRPRGLAALGRRDLADPGARRPRLRGRRRAGRDDARAASHDAGRVSSVAGSRSVEARVSATRRAGASAGVGEAGLPPHDSRRARAYGDAFVPGAGARPMPRFLAVYTMRPEDLATFRSLPEAEQKSRDAIGLKQWVEWEAANAASFPDRGGMVGRTKRVTRDGISDAQNAFCGYIVVEAESIEAAAHLFENHPHFTIFPGDGVDIMPFLTGP